MGIELDLLNHDVVKQLVAEAYKLGADSGSPLEENDDIIEIMRIRHGEENEDGENRVSSSDT